MRKPPKPLGQARLQELALAYVARFATSRVKLERYLSRKLRERGWEDENPPDINALSDKYVELGYIDEPAFARARSGGLLRRGYGPRRVEQVLEEAGIGADLREDIRPGVRKIRHSALTMARKRRFGPFAIANPDRPAREKQIAAMLRAGHDLDSALRLVNAASALEAEQWTAEFDDEENYHEDHHEDHWEV